MFSIFLQQQAQQEGGGFPMQFIFLGGMLIVFYFFMIRPQQKKAKDQKSFKENIKKGDNVITIGGLHGKVVSIESDDTIILEVDKIRMKFEKSAISLEYSKKTLNTTTTDKDKA